MRDREFKVKQQNGQFLAKLKDFGRGTSKKVFGDIVQY